MVLMTGFALLLLQQVLSIEIATKSPDLEDQSFWQNQARSHLDALLQRKILNYRPKNIIVFIGDGMGLNTISAARIYEGQTKNMKGERNELSFESFPSIGISKTYSTDRQVSDSASTATAMFCGVKTNSYTLGYDMNAKKDVCHPDINQHAKLTSVMEWAQAIGKDTGIVTTTRVTHATPAGTYASSNSREWECDSKIPEEYKHCAIDIAKQLVTKSPANKFKVIMGGGLKQFGYVTNDTKSNDTSCFRSDGVNLVDLWKSDKKSATFVMNVEELLNVDINRTEHLLGLFDEGHMSYAGVAKQGRPSLETMTLQAIRMLKKNANGFVLMVEGGAIDLAHHQNYIRLALEELVELDAAVAAAVNMTDPNETLIIVTADHSHALTFNGYAKRGNDILGLSKNSSKITFPTLTYANGPGFEYHHIKAQDQLKMENCKENCSDAERDSANSWRNLQFDKSYITNPKYRPMTTVYLEEDTHGGEDVPVYATGPLSHLLQGVFEQSYIGNFLSYALCSGPQKEVCFDSKLLLKSPGLTSATTSVISVPSTMLLTLFCSLLFV